MKIGFRVDSSNSIGSGHLMRCLALASGLNERGHAVFFVCRGHIGSLHPRIESVLGAGTVSVLSSTSPRAVVGEMSGVKATEYAGWLGATVEADAAQTAAALKNCFGEQPVDWLVIDHYALSKPWQTALRSCCRKILVIDDLADREHDCDALVDADYFRDAGHRYDGLVPSGCRLLLGPSHALLRAEFGRARPGRGWVPTVDALRVLVFFGAADPAHMTLKVVEALGRHTELWSELNIVAGSGNVDLDEIKLRAASLKGARVLVDQREIAPVMLGSDLFIGAGGVVTYERMALGLAGLVYAVAENQEGVSSELGRDGYQFYLGPARDADLEQLVCRVATLSSDREQLARISERGMGLVDGRGVERVVAALTASG